MPLLMCPNCNASMTEVKRADVAFDMCPTCRAVWLDRGELEKIIAGAKDERAAFARDRDQFDRDPDAYRRSHPRDRWRDDDDDDDDRRGGRRAASVCSTFSTDLARARGAPLAAFVTHFEML